MEHRLRNIRLSGPQRPIDRILHEIDAATDHRQSTRAAAAAVAVYVF
jgi:hypothetical protein